MMHALLLALVVSGPPALSSGQIETDPHRLIEIRVDDVAPPPGYEIATQEWLILSQDVDWRQYDNGSVLVATAPPGEYQARWRGQYVNWEDRQFRSEWRVYTIRVRGPPAPQPPVTPPEPVVPPSPDLVGPVDIVVIADATNLDVDQNAELLELRTGVDAREGVRFFQFAPDAQSGDGTPNPTVSKFVAQIPAAAELPYAFIVQADQSGAGHILWQGAFTTADEIMEALK